MDIYVNEEINIFCPGIYLNLTDWDDWFKYQTLYTVDYVRDSNVTRIGSIKIGQENMKRSPDLKGAYTELPKGCYSLGTDSSFYVELNKIVTSDKERISILINLKDVAYNSSLLAKYKKEPAFRISLLRDQSMATIEQRFRRLAHGESKPISYSFKYKLNSQNDDEISFYIDNEDDALPTNIHAIIGRNGVGKSRLIKDFLRAVFDYDEKKVSVSDGKRQKHIAEFFKKIVYMNFSVFDDVPSELESTKGNMPFITLNNKTNLKGIYGKYNNGEFYTRREREIAYNQDMLVKLKKDNWLGVFMDSTLLCFDKKPILWKDTLKELNTDPVFARHNWEGLLTLYEKNRLNYKNNEDTKSNQEYLRQMGLYFERLSSGHKIVMLSLTKIIEVIDEKVLVIIDEPELYLHPPLLSSYIRCLSKLMKSRNGVVILATHSPVVLQEIPDNCVYKLDREGPIFIATRPETRTFAQNISTLMAEVFGLEAAESGFIRIIEESVSEGKSFEEIYQLYGDRLGSLGYRLLVTKTYREAEKYEE